MQAGDITLSIIFSTDHHHVIPLFQRPYVWDEEANWTPLWEDITAAGEEVEAEVDDDNGRHDPRTYFLGAVVVQSRKMQPRRLSSSNVIDGQQRLTTLQVLLGAARRAALFIGAETCAGKFATLIENKRAAVHPEHLQDLYKLWPLPQDNEPFQWAMRELDSAAPAGLVTHKIVRASQWFDTNIRKWMLESADPELRLEHLFVTLRDRMQLVRIVLDSHDDPQVIFEALNHRGVPLDAADLVKNLLFQKVELQGDHRRADSLLMDGWLPLDGPIWRKEVTTGRVKRSQIDLLLSYWLTIRSEHEVSAEHLFVDFKEWLATTKDSAADIIQDIRKYADKFLELKALPETHAVAQLLDRMEATGMLTPWPLLLYIFSNDKVPADQKTAVARAVDSFLIRRGVCRLSTADYNRLFVQLIGMAQVADAETAGTAVVGALANQTAESRRWPTDDEFLEALSDNNLYQSVVRARLKTLLVGLENHLQSEKTEPGKHLSATERKLNIEHLMPQSWEKNWALPDDADEAAHLRRQMAIHSLGNLTLTTTRLNPSLSNNGWQSKKHEIRRHSLLRITTGSVLARPNGVHHFTDEGWVQTWDEQRIQDRGEFLARSAVEVWSRPKPGFEANVHPH